MAHQMAWLLEGTFLATRVQARHSQGGSVERGVEHKKTRRGYGTRPPKWREIVIVLHTGTGCADWFERSKNNLHRVVRRAIVHISCDSLC